MSGKPQVLNSLLKTESEIIPVGSPRWFDWLKTSNKFAYKDDQGRFVARSEMRRNQLYWYAERRRSGKLTRTYLGKSVDLSIEKLKQASLALTGILAAEPLEGLPADKQNGLVEARIDSSLRPIAKITAPMLPNQLVSRSRLLQKLKTPLTVIHAPSGFGKSTLLNNWKQSCDFPVAWLTLDLQDNHAFRFWYSVVSAFQVSIPDFGTELLLYLGTSPTVQPFEVVFYLTRDILKCLAKFSRLALVLDDFHNINQSEIYDAIQFLLEHLPADFWLLISGHTRPSLSLGSLRARGLLTELDINDLRFNTVEGIRYLKQYTQEPSIAYDDLEKLVKHSEGWAAGLTLSALALTKQEDRRQFMDTFSGAHIYMREYFMETVLQRCSLETQSFLLRTAILKNLTGNLCDAVTGQTNGDEMLERLWREGLFTVRTENQGWFKYHDLFAEMLNSQLSNRFPDEIPHLHERAAHWFHQQLAFAEAIYHLLLIEAWEEAATLIEEMALRELEQFGEDSRLLRWLQELPEGVVQKHKHLLFVYMRLASLALPQSKIEKFITNIEKSLSNKPAASQTEDERDVLIEIHQIRHIWAKGQAYLPPKRSENAYESQWNLINRLYLLRPAYRQYQNFPEEPIVELLREAQERRNLYVTMLAGGVLAKRIYFGGQLRRSEKLCRQILDQAQSQRGKLPETASIALEVLSLIHFERNEIDLAQRYLTRAIEVDPKPTSTNMPIHFSILRAKIQMVLNQNQEALATIQAARMMQMKNPGGLLENEDLLAYEAWISVRVGEIGLAEQLLAESERAAEHHLLRQVRAEIFLKSGRYQDAEVLLADTIDKFFELIVIEPLLEIRILLAQALSGQNKMNQALQVMIEAIRLAAPERFFRPFLNAGLDCVPLFWVAIETLNLSDESSTFIKELLNRLSVKGQIPTISKNEMQMLSTSTSITLREQEILQLLSIGCSNRDIAEKLSISESTVKTHLGHIYQKLDVKSRGQAVSHAKQIKVVP